MIQALRKPVSFEEFIAWYPEDSESCYKLHWGVIVEMPKPRSQNPRARMSRPPDF
jgi:Uma2 family endonuclease